jgi:transcription antitermination factor NusB
MSIPVKNTTMSERSAARMAAIQALYQMDIAGTGLLQIIAEYETFWIGREVDGVHFQPADRTFFKDVLKGVVREQRAIDPIINSSLTPNWPLTRIMPVLRSILRAGVYELTKRKDVPVRVILSEYVDIARSYYDDDEPGLVNAVLDKVARSIREEELNKQ